MFVSSSQTYVRFRTALAGRQLAEAFEAAKALPGHLSLLDALELTLLAGEVEKGRVFEDCGARWLARVAVERGLTLTQLLEAGARLKAAAAGEDDRAFEALAGLL
jgi:hypothetical protein